MSATRDLRSNIANDLAFYRSFTINETHPSYIFDTADYDGGIMFSFGIHDYTDGTYTTTLYESDDSGMAGETVIPDEKLIGSLSDLIFTSGISNGDALTTIGIVGTKRYVRIKIVSTSVTIGAQATIVTSKMPEILKV